VDYIITFRRLWHQHVLWTRLFIISVAHDLGDLDLTTKRLLRNPADFAEVLEPCYGAEAADKFKDLFTQHLEIGGDLVKAAKKGDMKTVMKKEKEWYKNADEIAEFLPSINPCWTFEEWQKMMYDHLRMTENEAVQRLHGKFAKDIAQYDEIEDEAMMMADVMSSGVIRQFGC